MPRRLLTATALFVTGTAAAGAPVDTQRVTGNVSTEHSQAVVRPVIDSCRVTGNVSFAPATKAMSQETDMCLLTVAGATGRLPLSLFNVDQGHCSAVGIVVRTEAGPQCRLGTEQDPIDVQWVPPASTSTTSGS